MTRRFTIEVVEDDVEVARFRSDQASTFLLKAQFFADYRRYTYTETLDADSRSDITKDVIESVLAEGEAFLERRENIEIDRLATFTVEERTEFITRDINDKIAADNDYFPSLPNDE